MNKIWIAFFMLFVPGLSVAADSSLSFNPPATDYSVIFLANIFGIVDGVLHGTGSQIMGNMFGVFNSAVLALGGIVVMYTLIVGTMNTAHEGQMLGQKWSSIWIPVRATIGLALLIPKSSGYCLMQIFIMWVVVQGVGAADKIWNSALDYLNQGGAIMQAQMSSNSTTTSSDNQALVDIATGASVMLSGQACMYALQLILEKKRTGYLQSAKSDSGVCSSTSLASSSADPDMVYFCKNTVPDFISTVNAVDTLNSSFVSACSSGYSYTSTGGTYSLPMPNFTTGNYVGLNGVCGYIKWNDFDASALASSTTLSCSDVDTIRQARAVAVQQMYTDLTSVAEQMVENDPQIYTSSSDDTSSYYSTVARNQFGIPMLSDGSTSCSAPSSSCTNWGAQTGVTNQNVIFSGFELQNAMLDYDGIMLPSLNMVSELSSGDQANQLRAFIKGSEEVGWIMAGSYFFDLAYLNGMVTSKSDTVDSDSGLSSSTFDVKTFSETPFETCSASTLCSFLNNDVTYINYLVGLINGSTVGDTVSPNVSTTAKAITDTTSSSVYGYITNAAMVHLPGQPGLSMPTFNMNFNIQPGQDLMSFPKKSFSCGGKILGWCVGKHLGELFYNDIFRGIINVVISFITSTFSLILQSFLYVPLTDLMVIFNNGVQLLETTMVHPIIALAYMGASFINASVDIWLNLISFSIIFGVFTGGLAVIAIFLILPFLITWLGVMTTVGWIDAYYAPFIPYMIFTFGSIAWLMAVIESMVAGPIVALGVSHPEGHDALGKAEQAIMILINVFLRPAMMIIGYIASISLSYVTIFILNSGFVHIMQFLLPDQSAYGSSGGSMGTMYGSTGDAGTPYTNWSAMYASFFCLVTYTSLYLTVVQKSFNLIHALPDKILRWIGSQGETYGQDVQQWSEDSKGQIKDTGEQQGKVSAAMAQKPLEAASSAVTGASEASTGGESGVS